MRSDKLLAQYLGFRWTISISIIVLKNSFFWSKKMSVPILWLLLIHCTVNAVASFRMRTPVSIPIVRVIGYYIFDRLKEVYIPKGY